MTGRCHGEATIVTMVPQQHESIGGVADGEADLWLPPRRLSHYQIAKGIAALLAIAIFSGWLWIQWSNLFIRIVAITLSFVTACVTLSSMLSDRRRARGRQIAAKSSEIIVTSPADVVRIDCADIDRGVWHDDGDACGLKLIHRDGRTLVLLDGMFFRDQAEARAFVGWCRKRTGCALHIVWEPTG